MLKKNLTVKFSSVLICSMCLLIIIGSPYIQQRVNNTIKIVLEIIESVLAVNIWKVRKKELKSIMPIFLFFCSMCLCTVVSQGIGTKVLNAVVTGGAYVVFFLFIGIIAKKYSIIYVEKIITNIMLIYMLILDCIVIITAGKGLGGMGEAVYLLGNKFMVSYIHMFVLSMFAFRKSRKHRYIYVLTLFFYSIFMCHITDTTTGIIGCTLIFAFWFILEKFPLISNILAKPIVVLGFFLGINAVFLLSGIILNNSFLNDFFLARSHTSTILSGRVPMYQIAMSAIARNPICGYGINYGIVEAILSFGNPQNGLLKLLLDYGIVGTSFFCLMLFYTFKQASSSQAISIKNGCMVFIYSMLVCSLVEINLAAIFMLACAMLNGTGNSKLNIDLMY